jgi:hypothetical protein
VRQLPEERLQRDRPEAELPDIAQKLPARLMLELLEAKIHLKFFNASSASHRG